MFADAQKFFYHPNIFRLFIILGIHERIMLGFVGLKCSLTFTEISTIVLFQYKLTWSEKLHVSTADIKLKVIYPRLGGRSFACTILQNCPQRSRAANEIHTCLSRHVMCPVYPVMDIPCQLLKIYVIVIINLLYIGVDMKNINLLKSAVAQAGQMISLIVSVTDVPHPCSWGCTGDNNLPKQPLTKL